MFDSKNAACKGIATSLFYEDKVSPQLKALCRYCPIAEQCRDWALRHEKFGYWGGTTEAQRIIERRERNITVLQRATTIMIARTSKIKFLMLLSIAMY